MTPSPALQQLASQFDHQQIAMLRALRKGALLPQLLAAYRTQILKQAAELRQALDAADHATLRIVAHTLKSASFSVGAKRIGELCTQLEANAIKANYSDNLPLLVELESCMTELLPELDGYLQP